MSRSAGRGPRDVLIAFLDDLAGRLGDTHQLERVLTNQETLSSADVGQRPETYTENELIYPLIESMGLEWNEQPYGEAGGRVVWPDFDLTNVPNDIGVIGENKPLNNVDEAIPEIKDYLDRRSIDAEYGIATDGIGWYLLKIELGGDITEYPTVDSIDFRDTLLELAREQGHLPTSGLAEVDVDEPIEAFVETFRYDNFTELITETAPREIRDDRKRDVEEFYELYIELLFGASDEYDYETSLMDDIQPPEDASETDERLFAITLMNRLLFIKFLETKGVLDDGFLRERVRQYEQYSDEFAGNLYETQIKPLFYKLFNTEIEDRKPKHRDGWFAEIPYLNGGLFRENLPNEAEYTVADRILPTVIDDLIEGSRLELNGESFDPAILGSVFEKTITYIEQEREQKDIGAYYTPNDVTELVTRRAVDPKIKDVLIEAYAAEVAGEGEERSIQASMREHELSGILRAIENGEGWFGNPEAAEQAFERLNKLKVVDPACGSGHFLTTAMDEVYRVQLSLLRGLNRGDDPSPQRQYEVKKELALNAIYGVDVDPIGTEIAKLRVWLKIVEGNSWEPDFGRLPNIDVNIAAGNSIVGLPVKGIVESADIWDEDIDELVEMREAYKFHDEGDRRDIEEFMKEEVRPRVNDAFLARFNDTVSTSIGDEAEFEAVVEAIDEKTLFPIVESVKVQRTDGEDFTDEQEANLDEKGFTVYTKSARLDIEKREHNLKNNEVEGVKDVIIEELRELIEGPYEFDEFVRRPLSYDLDNILGQPFHWPVEFPELAEENGSQHTIHFDIVLGNPPYGHITSESEDVLTSTYEMGGADIAATFVERQLQMLNEDGYFGNVTTLKLMYKAQMEPMHDIWRDYLATTRVACFAKRPSKVFEGAEVRVAIITGLKQTADIGDILTSEFIRFDNDKDRIQRFREISYRNTEDFTLRKDGINGSGNHVALPKIGLEHIEDILSKLRGQSSLIGEREVDSETDHVIWRREGMDYFTNPMLEKLYDAREVKPFYFDTALEACAAFLTVSSSIFYVYWCVYGDMFHLNLSEIRAFPLPPMEVLEIHQDDIMDISARLWERMVDGFNDVRNEFDNYDAQKPIIEEADEVVGEMFGLTEPEVEFAQGYHSEYGRHGPDDEQLTEYSP